MQGKMMLALRLSSETEKRLTKLAKRTGHTKSYYARLAIEEFLEDQEDYLIALERIKNKLQSIPREEVERILDLED
jgi:RHH-type rel operon transcriptional repressor/antitoxin RelB